MNAALVEPASGIPAEEWARKRLQTVVGDSFQVKSLLGRGAFADVFDAFEPQLKRSVAIKVLRADLPHSREVQQRFRREAELIAGLRHPHLVPIHAIGERDGIVYLVLEHIRGESLEQTLGKNPLPGFGEVRRFLGEVLEALDTAHAAGVVHRDLKPDNIMLEGAERRVLLMDFGIARALTEEASFTSAGMFLGTPQYCSPEQIAGDVVDARSDLYAVGVIGYRLLTGRLPFDGPSITAILGQHLSRLPSPVRQLRPDCPPELAHAVERALAKSPSERWESAQAMRAALARSEALHTDAPEPLPAGSEAPERARLRRAALMAAAALAGVAAFTVLVLREPTLLVVSFVIALASVAGSVANAWVRGVGLHELFAARPAPERSGLDELGRHGGAVRAGQRDRTQIVRRVSALSKVEQRRFHGCVAAADHLLLKATQLARRLSALDVQVGAERVRERGKAELTLRAPRRLLDELVVARAHTSDELQQVLETLEELRRSVLLADAPDGDAELTAALMAAEQSARG